MKARITKAQLQAAIKHASTDAKRAGYHGITVDAGELVSTDGHRMATIKVAAETQAREFLPLDAAKRIDKMAGKNDPIELAGSSVSVGGVERGHSGIGTDGLTLDYGAVRKSSETKPIAAIISVNARYLADAAKAAAEISGDPNAPVTLVIREKETPLMVVGGFQKAGDSGWDLTRGIEVLIMPVRF